MLCSYVTLIFICIVALPVLYLITANTTDKIKHDEQNQARKKGR
jgi:hypothetical protein